jgi:uncharacterized protein
MMNSKLVRVILAALVAIAVAAGGYVYYDRTQVHTVRIGTSGPGNISYTFSEALANVASRETKQLRLTFVETKGSAENMQLLQEGKIDLAVVQNDTPAAPQARMVASLYPQLFHLIVPVDSPIQSVADLKGKRVGTPAAGGSSYAAFMILIGHYDLGPEDFAAFKNLSSGELVDGLLKGELDAVFGADAMGEERPTKLVGSGFARLVPVDQGDAMRLTMPYIESLTIPKGAYKANPPLPAEDLLTVGIQVSLVAHKDLKPGVVQEITRLLFDHRLELAKAAPQLTALKSPHESATVTIAVHEGAMAYYERDKPGFLEANVDIIGLLITLITMAASGVLAVRSMLSQRQKKRADQYNEEIVALMDLVQGSADAEQLAKAERRLFDLFKDFVDDMDHDRISNDSAESFMLAWNQAIQSVRHRQLLVSPRGA